MSSRNDETPENDGFVGRLRDAYAPPEMTPGRAARFDRRLAERRRGRRWWAPTLVMAGAAAALALFAWPTAPEAPRRGVEPAPQVAAAETTNAWSADDDNELFAGLYDEWDDTEVGAELLPDDEVLPGDYEMLALLIEPDTEEF